MLFILQQIAVAFQLAWILYLVSWLIFIRNVKENYCFQTVGGIKQKKLANTWIKILAN